MHLIYDLITFITAENRLWWGRTTEQIKCALLPSQPWYITEERPQHRELHALLCVGSFTSHRIINIEGLWDAAYSLIVLIQEE